MERLLDRLFAAHTTYGSLEEELTNTMLTIFGVPQAQIDLGENWPFEEVTWDWYDQSVELKQANPGLSLATEQQILFWETGFRVLFICYSDGTERTYSKDRFEKGEPVDGPIRDAHRRTHFWQERSIRNKRALSESRALLQRLVEYGRMEEHELDCACAYCNARKFLTEKGNE